MRRFLPVFRRIASDAVGIYYRCKLRSSGNSHTFTIVYPNECEVYGVSKVAILPVQGRS